MSIDRRTVIEGSLGAALAGTIFGSSTEVLAGGGTAQQSGITLQGGVRRIITGNDAQGKSYFVSDDRVAPGSGGFPSLFRTTGDNKVGPGPDDDSLELRPTDMPQIEPAPVRSSFHYQTLPPTADAEPVWHTTETVDYNILLSGELVLMVDAGEVTLHPGRRRGSTQHRARLAQPDQRPRALGRGAGSPDVRRRRPVGNAPGRGRRPGSRTLRLEREPAARVVHRESAHRVLVHTSLAQLL